MPPSILTKAEIKVSCQRRERIDSFIKTYLRVIDNEASDVEINWGSPSDNYKVNILVPKAF